MIDIRDVSKSFTASDGRRIRACQNISLTIGRNEFVSVVGPSGCGKSTLIRMIAGLIPTTEGTLTIDGQAVTRPTEKVAIVFQKATLLPWASVLDNVLFPISLHSRVTADDRRRAMELLAMVGLAGFEHQRPDELSGGMQQRAAICRALIQKAEVLIMDEPFGALDALTREEMGMELLRIWTQSPRTVIFVTHSISEAVSLSDRVVVMSPRPGSISEIHPIDIPRPRGANLESHPEFQIAAGRIRDRIFQTPLAAE